MTINEYKVKLTGTANLSKELALGEGYDIIIKNAEVRKSEDLPNDDGTADRVFKLQISELSEVSIINENGVIGAKKKGSQAKVLRWAIEQKADELGEDREEYYQRRMSEIIEAEKY